MTPPKPTNRADRFVSRDGDFTIKRAAGKPPLRAAETLGLVELRRRRHLTQVQLAERMGSTQDRVSRLEHGRDPMLSSVLEYLEGLGAADIEIAITFPDGERDHLTVSLPSTRESS
jgi:DNA-binding XRE family transcriptional regulator